LSFEVLGESEAPLGLFYLETTGASSVFIATIAIFSDLNGALIQINHWIARPFTAWRRKAGCRRYL